MLNIVRYLMIMSYRPLISTVACCIASVFIIMFRRYSNFSTGITIHIAIITVCMLACWTTTSTIIPSANITHYIISIVIYMFFLILLHMTYRTFMPMFYIIPAPLFQVLVFCFFCLDGLDYNITILTNYIPLSF